MARIPGALPGPMKPIKPVDLNLKQPVINNNRQVHRTFSETMEDFVQDVNDLQEHSGKTVERFLTGEIENVHDVMVAVEKAGISFELMMEIRNKMIEAYHEVMRMQV